MLECVPTRSGVVPRESFVDVRGAADVVPRRIALASEDVDESSADALHVDRRGIFRAAKNLQEFWDFGAESTPKYADVALFKLRLVRRI